MSSGYPPFGGPPVQRCIRCGSPLPSNVVTCVNCGTYNPIVQPGVSSDQRQVQWGGSQPQTSFGNGQYSGQQWGPQTLSSSQNNQWGQSQTPSQNTPFTTPYTPKPASPPDNFYAMPGLQQATNFNSAYASPQQNAYHRSATTTYEGYAPPMGYYQPPQQKRGPKIGLVVGIILLVLMLVGGAFAGYTYFKYHNQKSTVANVTPTIKVTSTAAPLFSDSFANNSKAWDLTSYAGKFSVKIGSGALVLEDDQNKLLWEVLPGKNFAAFRLDVNATLTKGDTTNGYGVLIRAASQGNDLGTYYRFELYGDGTYAVFKGTLDASGNTQSTKVQGYTAQAAIAKAGQVNHLSINASGPTMKMIVNGQVVATYTDDTYKSGSVALFLSNLPGLRPGAQATFSNLAVFPVS